MSRDVTELGALSWTQGTLALTRVDSLQRNCTLRMYGCIAVRYARAMGVLQCVTLALGCADSGDVCRPSCMHPLRSGV